jgi:hypothetical protein
MRIFDLKRMFLLLFLVAVLTSCLESNTNNRSLIGRWRIEDGNLNIHYGLRSSRLDSGSVIEFFSNGTVLVEIGTRDIPSGSISSWHVDNNRILFTESWGVAYTFTISGNTLTLSRINQDNTLQQVAKLVKL